MVPHLGKFRMLHALPQTALGIHNRRKRGRAQTGRSVRVLTAVGAAHVTALRVAGIRRGWSGRLAPACLARRGNTSGSVSNDCGGSGLRHAGAARTRRMHTPGPQQGRLPAMRSEADGQLYRRGFLLSSRRVRFSGQYLPIGPTTWPGPPLVSSGSTGTAGEARTSTHAGRGMTTENLFGI